MKSIGSAESQFTPLGWIPYLNLLPLKTELQRENGLRLQLVEGHPTYINKALSEARVGLAPCSSICLLQNAMHEIALPLGVVASHAVQSVYLVLPKDFGPLTDMVTRRLAEVKEIISTARSTFGTTLRPAAKFIWRSIDELTPFDPEVLPVIKFSANSASSVALAKLFYRLTFGKKAYEANVARSYAIAGKVDPVQLELIIGDDALIRRQEFSKILDLAYIWNYLTNLPFVFAIWQKIAGRSTNGWGQRIMAAAELAQARMHVEPCRYMQDIQLPGHVDLAKYWRGIRYRLTPEDFQGLLLFLTLTRDFESADADDKLLVKMMRWQEYSQTAIAQ